MKWIKQTARYRVQNNGYRMLKELTENFNSMKKDVETTIKKNQKLRIH